jgi:hypothetical protein
VGGGVKKHMEMVSSSVSGFPEQYNNVILY